MSAARPDDARLFYGDAAAEVAERIAALERDDVPRRLWAHDVTLWGDDAGRRQVAANRLGWLDAPATLRPHARELAGFAAELRDDGYTHAVLLGMGGSSLAPEVLARTFGHAGGLALSVLDSTSPAAVRAVAAAHDPARTAFVVASKSGGTLEVTSFERRFWDWAGAARGAEAGRGFVAITDPGTVLERHAHERGYRRTFLNPADIGGRYSALSYFGLVPAALLGLDVDTLLARAADEAARSRAAAAPGGPPNGFTLGAALGALARHGRDKLTLVLGPEFEAFGAWVEQLVAESTGKDGRGIVPVVGEALAAPATYGSDRVFVAFGAAPLAAPTSAALDALERAGHPVLRWRDPDLASLGAEFLRWEIATAVAAMALDVDPFDEPNVTEAKQATQTVLERARATGAAAPDAAAPRVEAPGAIAARLAQTAGDRRDPGAWVAALLGLAQPGDYFAVLAYLRATPEVDARLQRIRHAARAATGVATTTGYGPRFLHSTGQLHKGGANTGVFLQLTADESPDEPIPGAPYGFATLIAAQAAGDYEVLERRGRRVLRVHLGARPLEALDAIAETLAAKV